MTIEELRKIAETERAAQKKCQHHVCVCIAAGCLSSGADEVRDALKKEVAESGMQNEVLVKGVGCMGLCSAGPLVSVTTDGQMFAGVNAEAAPEIIRGLDRGSDTSGSGLTRCRTDVPFFERQKKIVLENSGVIDPERVEDYIAHDGYHALVTAITEMTPQEVIEQVKSSGLRGRHLRDRRHQRLIAVVRDIVLDPLRIDLAGVLQHDLFLPLEKRHIGPAAARPVAPALLPGVQVLDDLRRPFRRHPPKHLLRGRHLHQRTRAAQSHAAHALHQHFVLHAGLGHFLRQRVLHLFGAAGKAARRYTHAHVVLILLLRLALRLRNPVQFLRRHA